MFLSTRPFRKRDKSKYASFFSTGCAWEVGSPVMLHIGEAVGVSCMTAIHGRLWCGLGCNAVIVNTTTLEVEVGPSSLLSTQNFVLRSIFWGLNCLFIDLLKPCACV